jgi:hypothetical protein
MHLTRNKQRDYVMARIMRNATMHQKNFSRKEFKTWKAAEAEAEKWLTELKKTLPESKQNATGLMNARNESGIVGVRLCKNVRKMKNGNKHTYWSWKAKWPECELKGGIAWSINSERNDEDAFVLAALARKYQSVDRDFLQSKLVKINGSDEHFEILQSKALGPSDKTKKTRRRRTKAKKTVRFASKSAR